MGSEGFYDFFGSHAITWTMVEDASVDGHFMDTVFLFIPFLQSTGCPSRNRIFCYRPPIGLQDFLYQRR